jgi:hypothetical protein
MASIRLVLALAYFTGPAAPDCALTDTDASISNLTATV